VRVRIRGCRGTIASPGADTMRYGGNTSCVEVRLSSGRVVILDAGTGIRELGVQLMQEGVTRIDLLLTHLHVDHLEGLGTFAPIWSPDVELHIWGPASPVASLAERIATYFSPPLFPAVLPEVAARIEFHDASGHEWEVDGARLASDAIVHPGATVGYRIREGDRVLAFLTDHEPALAADVRTTETEWISGFALMDRADLLIHDCQYTPEEYATRLGFGHSSTEHLAALAERAGPERVVMYHHDPMHSDTQLEAMRADVLHRWGVPEDRVLLAAEGDTYDL
jgi:phosphoribosyl 1,2-cyclic phosphodiesterase